MPEWLGGAVSDAWMDSERWKRCLSGLGVRSAVPGWTVSAGSDALSGLRVRSAVPGWTVSAGSDA